MELTCKVLRVVRYDFEDEKSGRRFRGCKLIYTDGEVVRDNFSAGLILNESKGDYRLFDKLAELVPGYVTFRVRLVPGRNGASVYFEDVISEV